MPVGTVSIVIEAVALLQGLVREVAPYYQTEAPRVTWPAFAPHRRIGVVVQVAEEDVIEPKARWNRIRQWAGD